MKLSVIKTEFLSFIFITPSCRFYLCYFTKNDKAKSLHKFILSISKKKIWIILDRFQLKTMTSVPARDNGSFNSVILRLAIKQIGVKHYLNLTSILCNVSKLVINEQKAKVFLNLSSISVVFHSKAFMLYEVVFVISNKLQLPWKYLRFTSR